MIEQKKTLDFSQVKSLPAIPEEAIAIFKEAKKGHEDLLKKMASGIQLSIVKKLGSMDEWIVYELKTQGKILAHIFEDVRKIMKIDDPDSGLSMTPSTFKTCCTRIKRVFIYHVSLDNSHFSNTACQDALNIALNKFKGGTLKEKVEKALEDLRKPDSGWSGNPPIIRVKLKENTIGSKENVEDNRITLPPPGFYPSSKTIKIGLKKFFEWTDRSDIKKIFLETIDPDIKCIKCFIDVLHGAYENLSEEEKVEEVTAVA